MNNASSEEKRKIAKTSPPEPAKNTPKGDDLQRIRDILFGDQVNTYDARFETLESRTRSDKTELRGDVLKHLSALEGFVKGELTALSDRIRTEREERSRVFRQISKELRDGMEATEKRIAEYAAQSEKDLHEFREQFLAYSQTVRDEIRAVAEEEPGASLPH